MEIIIASHAGFCFGVKRAIKTTYDTAEKAEGEVATLGPLIHNPQVVSRLESMGVRPIENILDFDGEALIIRSHGVPASVVKTARDAGIKLVDATCPFVKKAQEYARQLKEEGCTVVIVGDKDHPEVQGLLSYAGDSALVAADHQDLEGVRKVPKIGIIAQTTTTFETFERIVRQCLRKAKEIRIYNTICDATHVRQQEAQEIARKVDLMLVVGGRNSGNTTRLAELCGLTGTRTFHIETQDEIDPFWFQDVKEVGITAGASTPEWIIEMVIERLNQISEKSG
ncbi:MAG: 4-hydroxy-3-methylbut-2-enyl diphosphate reductase [bacterium]